MNPQRVIITGGATNIGRAITEGFLAEGSRVVIGQPDPAIAKPLLDRYGDGVSVLPVDVGDPVQCRKFVDAAAAQMGGLDVLVNNAAITGVPAVASLEALTPADFARIVAVNLGGAIFCSQAAIPHFRNAGSGVIVHLSSINAIRPQRGAMLYAATKAAVSSLAQSMGKELANERIRVVAVAPGDIRVDTSQQVTAALAAVGAGADVVNQTPLGQGEPADVATTVVFLCSKQAKFVTGTTWVVDGGLLA